MKSPRHQEGKPALELLEEAVHLLRGAPVSCLVAYYLGSVPFLVGLLFFWADMSRSAFAAYHTVEAALGMALLFLWMKTWQTIFARRLRVVLSGHERKPLSVGEIARIAVSQAVLHSVGLFVVPLSLVAVIPFGWVYAFSQSATVLAENGLEGLPRFSAKLVRHSALWPQQNHALLVALFGFGLVVFLNWVSVSLSLPFLARTLFGIENVFTRSVFSLLNTTFFAAMFGLTYLAVDPLVKAAYLLRCFYGDSLKSGEDVRGELERLAAITDAATGRVRALAVCILACALSFQTACSSEVNLEASPSPSAPYLAGAAAVPQGAESVTSEELDKAIQDTITKRKYAWRMPRDKAPKPPPEQSLLSRFFEKVGEMFQRALKAVGRWLENFLRGLFQGRSWNKSGSSSTNWVVRLQMLAYILIAIAVGTALWLLFRHWRAGRLRLAGVSSTPIAPAPDLTDENIGADQLPEDGWIRLGRELLEQGEFRLALRAFYLASLTCLADRNLVSLARFKSNLDYLRELQRRAHAFPEVASLFHNNVGVFDRVWYGMHPVDANLVHSFAANVDRLKGVSA